MFFKHGSLFTGFGIFDHAAKTIGFKNVFGCEIDSICRQHFVEQNPNTLLFGDIKKVNELPSVDFLSFGFPCQDVSNANPVKNHNPLEDGQRTILFWEAIRLIQQLERKPSFIVAENVDQIRSKGLEKVLQAFADCGYISTWASITASSFGALHKRKRVFIISHTNRFRWDTGISIFDRVITEGKKRKFMERQLYSDFYQEFQTEADPQRHGDYNEATQRLFDGLLVKGAGNAIYYGIAEAITREIKEELENH